MPVRTFVFFTVFSSHKDTYGLVLELAEPFHKELKVSVIEFGILKVFGSVSERNEGVFRMHLGFVNAADSPLASVIQTTSEALSAWKLPASVLFATFSWRPANGFAVGFKPDGARRGAPQLRLLFVSGKLLSQLPLFFHR